MKDFRMIRGTNIKDWFIIPTIRVHHGFSKYVTIEWFNVYVGVMWE
jgi:hypothetical protein